MQEEIEHKTVNFSISTVKLSARTLLKGAQFFLRQYDKSASQGKQSMKRLIRQNRGVTNVEIQKTGIKDFDRYAKQQGAGGQFCGRDGKVDRLMLDFFLHRYHLLCRKSP